MVSPRSGLRLAVFILIFSYLSYEFYFKVEYSPVIKISSGQIRGIVSKSRLGKEFYKFVGIRYAQPPGHFKNPLPEKPWEGILDAVNYGQHCIQVDGFTKKISGSHDCLFLNVYVPKEAFLKKRKMAVVFYIHGGYFMLGTSTYMGPEYILDEEIILVTINYRLNVFGFLNTGDSSSTGNFGLKDQNLALKWVQKNIHYFSGDNSRVTIAGQSAGSAAVHFHLLSPKSKGLFSSAIMLSGTAIKPWSLASDTLKQATNLAKQVNCPTNKSTQELVDCLRNKNPEDLIIPQRQALDTPIMDPLEIFAPSIEKCEIGDNSCFLTEHPYDILLSGKSSKVPILTGGVAHEGLLATGRVYVNSTLTQHFETNWMALLPNLLFYNETDYPELTKKILKFYTNSKSNERKANFLENFENITNALSDRLYTHATRETVKIQSKSSKVYLYHFKYPVHRGMVYLYDIVPYLPVIPQFIWKEIKWFINEYILFQDNLYLGVAHGDLLSLLFKYPMIHILPGSKDFKMSRQMVKLLVEFARNPEQLTLNGNPWPPINADGKELKYMLISNESDYGSLVDEPFAQRMKFWDDINLPWKLRDHKRL